MQQRQRVCLVGVKGDGFLGSGDKKYTAKKAFWSLLVTFLFLSIVVGYQMRFLLKFNLFLCCFLYTNFL